MPVFWQPHTEKNYPARQLQKGSWRITRYDPFSRFRSNHGDGSDTSEIILSSRPREGDLVYFPLGQRLFEIKFVEHEDPFYQLGKNYVYQLKCELFEYEDEVIDTSIEAIDTQVQEEGFLNTLKLVGLGQTAEASTSIGSGFISKLYLLQTAELKGCILDQFDKTVFVNVTKNIFLLYKKNICKINRLNIILIVNILVNIILSCKI